LIDAAPSSRDSAPLRGQPDVLNYFISFHHGFLPLRIGDYVFIADLEGIGWCYYYLFRLEMGSHFQMVPTSHAPTFSRRYIWWYHDIIRSYQSYTHSVMARSTCPRGRGSSSSGPTYDDFIPFPPLSSEPVDFQWLDNRCPCSSTRTCLTGTFQIHPFLS
jgi:hypothetical protein